MGGDRGNLWVEAFVLNLPGHILPALVDRRGCYQLLVTFGAQQCDALWMNRRRSSQGRCQQEYQSGGQKQ